MGLREVTVDNDRALQEIADTLAGSHKILLVTGAGISTSCGIPVRGMSPRVYHILTVQRISDRRMVFTI